jgi:hypothetical protein
VVPAVLCGEEPARFLVLSWNASIAVPVGAFLILLWAVHASITSDPVIRPVVIVSAALVVLLLPLAVESTGLAFVIATVATVCSAVIMTTILSRAGQPTGDRSGRPGV